MATFAANNPSFTCYSGELLWGQLHCIAEEYFNLRSKNLSNKPPRAVIRRWINRL